MNKPGDLVIKKHGDADEIWLLRRQKVKSGKAKLVIVASDTSPNAKKRAQGYVFSSAVPLVEIPYTKQELSDLRDAVYNNDFDKTLLVVNGTIDCESAATGTLYCKEKYDVWTEKDGTWKKNAEGQGTCTHSWTFTLPAREHKWSAPKLDKVTGEYYVECQWEDCKVVKETTEIKPEYTITLDGTKGTVVLKDKNMMPLNNAYVRISYGFELSDGSYLAMTTCMPISFDTVDGVQVGTFSFFALNTSLESTGVNYMVVDQYDAMNKTIGQLVGNNYGLYVE